MSRWTTKEEKELKKVFANKSNKELATIFNRPVGAITTKAKYLKLRKSQVQRRSRIYATQWTKEKLDYFTNTTNDALAKYLDTTIFCIKTKAQRLGLHKDGTHFHNNMVTRNKARGRDLNYAVLKDIAKQFKTKTEFYLNDSAACTAAKRLGVMNDICSHMFRCTESYPQLILFEILRTFTKEEIQYNTRKIITPYELDIYIPSLKFAIEYDGWYWHQGARKKEAVNKVDLCFKQGITLVTIPGTRNGHDPFKYVIEALGIAIKQVPKQLRITLKKLQAIDRDLVFNAIHAKVLDIGDIKRIVANYTYLIDFRKKELPLYNKLCRMGILQEYTKSLKRR